MNVLDLFSGIGGFSLGLERAGMRTVAFCEIEPYPRRVLARHWPGIPIYDDVKTLTAARLRTDGIAVDAICGGFPCQDISVAGKGAGIAEGTRSGLWSEYARLIDELRPRYVIVENVAALLSRGLDRVLGDLASLGYDAEWHCISAAAVGFPHERDRIWIIGHPNRADADGEGSTHLSHKDFDEWAPKKIIKERDRWVDELVSGNVALRAGSYADALRILDGIPAWVDRTSALGNAVVPQIPEIIGRAIMQAEALKN